MLRYGLEIKKGFSWREKKSIFLSPKNESFPKYHGIGQKIQIFF